MRILPNRVVAVVLGAFILGGCGGSRGPAFGQTVLPSLTPTPQSTASIDGASDAATPSCYYPKTWHFKGACVNKSMPSAGSTFTLNAIDGFSASVAFQNNNAPAGTKFFLAGGTDPSNITGVLGGNTFPFYGQSGVKCYPYNKSTPTKCAGKAFLYLQISNTSTKADVTFSATPKITVSNTNTFPGSKCQIDQLYFFNNATSFGWGRTNTYATPANGEAVFPTMKSMFTFPKKTFLVIALSCFSKR